MQHGPFFMTAGIVTTGFVGHRRKHIVGPVMAAPAVNFRLQIMRGPRSQGMRIAYGYIGAIELGSRIRIEDYSQLAAVVTGGAVDGCMSLMIDSGRAG